MPYVSCLASQGVVVDCSVVSACLVWLPRPLIGQLHSGMACLACDWLISDWCLT